MATTTPPRTPCWHCKHMLALDPRSTIVQCARPEVGRSFSKGGGRGCDLWEREPGVDDDDWDPPGVPQIAPYRPEPLPARRARTGGTDGWWTEPRRTRPAPKVVPITPVRPLPARDPFGGMFNWDEA